MSEHPNPAGPDRPDGVDGGDRGDRSDRSEGIDALLRDAMTAAPPPALPPTFTERVTERVHPRPLPRGARRTLRLYTLAATLLCVGVMASLGVDWPLIALALAVPAAVALLMWRRLP